MKTMQKTRKQISNLSLDIEIVNPIESKSLFGGCDYCDGYDSNFSHYGGALNNVNVGGGQSTSNSYSSNWDSWGYYFGYSSDWNNYGEDNNGSGGTSGGGGDGSVVLTDPVDLRDAPDHICTQLNQGTTCATMALSYVANYLGATGLTSSDFAEMSGKNYLSMQFGTQEGLDNTQLASIISTIFESSTIDGSSDSIVSNLSSGHPILATIDQGGGIGHEVVIVGFDPNAGTVKYMDSLVGGLVESHVSTLSFTGSLYAVSGVQNNSTVDKYKSDTNDVTCGVCGH